MFHYLFTNDLRISRLEAALIHASHCIRTDTVPTAQEDKNENNNIKTLAFYFNLTETSNCSIDCDVNQNVRNTVLNFIKKFQFPNPRTSASLQAAVNDGITLAPMRIVVQLLYNMNMLYPDAAYLTKDEILNFIFFNSDIAKTTRPNIIALAQQLIDYRSNHILPASVDTSESHREWKHSDRQIREMTKILQWAGCVTMEDNKIFIKHNNLSTENKAVLFDVLSFNEFWTPPSDDAGDPGVLTSYRQYMDMEEVAILNNTPSQERGKKVKYNRIYFGAPGTGKSHELDKDAKKLQAITERVTFYPNYSYAQFVGTYKPVMRLDPTTGKEDITYAYVPGPFMRQWIKAKNTEKPVLLIIEELNRANAPAVFGDMFQLLDRKNGESEYSVATSEDLRKYLKSLLPRDEETPQEDEFSQEGSPEEEGSDNENSCSEGRIREDWEQLPHGTDIKEIKIPQNLYIWATMNSADQGVFPLDTAFKRRWDYRYFSAYERKPIDKQVVSLLGENYLWGDIREAINNYLLSKNINEDKFIGAYFLDESVFQDEHKSGVNLEDNDTQHENDASNIDSEDENPFVNAFKEKVIMYLFEDAARQCRKEMFIAIDDNPPAYSKLIDKFSEIGFGIFSFSIPKMPVAKTDETDETEGVSQ